MIKPAHAGLDPATRFLLMLMLVVLVLHVGRPVLLPIAMTALLAFFLTPVIKRFERRGFPRVPAVIVTALTSLGIAAAAAWLVAGQLNHLAARLPTYRDNLIAKLGAFRLTGGIVANVQQLFNDVTATFAGATPPATVVRVIDPADGPFGKLQSLIGLALEPISNMGVVVVLLMFVLIYREDLRNRIVRLSGKRLALTTRTLDDLATRISRYLMATVLVNGCYGVAAAIGLWFIGVEYPALWGGLAAVLRFLPYVGPAIGIGLPITMAFIQFPAPDWSHVIYTAAFLAALETTTNLVIEPLTYGYSIGVSIVALLASALFWSWIWGPLGLLLSAPITVMLAVLGESVPSLERLGILLSDKPALDNDVIFYQRLLAGDADEAEWILEKEARLVGPLEAFDSIVIPAVIMAERETREGELASAEYDSIVDAAAEYVQDAFAIEPFSSDEITEPTAAGLRSYIIGCPVHDRADELALEALMRSLPDGGEGRRRNLSAAMLAAEMIALLRAEQPDAVCLSSLGPGGRRQLRYLCKRIRHELPQLRIIVGNWGYRRSDADKMAASLKQCGADAVFTSLAAARELLSALLPRSPLVKPAAASAATVRVATSG